MKIEWVELKILSQVHRTDPDVAVTNRVVVILKLDEDFGVVRRGVLGSRTPWKDRGVNPIGTANQFIVILGHNAVMNYGHNGFFDEFTFVVPTGRFKEDVIGLPLPGRLARIHQRG